MPLSLNSFESPPPGQKVPTAGEIRALAARVVMAPKSHRVELMSAIGDALGIPRGGWTQGISRLFDRSDVRIVWLLRALSGRGASIAASRNLLRAIQFVDAEVMLTLVTASREHAPAVTTNSLEFVDTFGEGGLDFLGAEMNRLGLPRSVTSQWATRTPFRNLESGSMIQPAEIPSRDQVLAYAAQLNASFQQRFKHYLRDCVGDKSADALAKSYRASVLVWRAYAFLAPGGVEYDAKRSLTSQLGQRFGIRTCLQFIKSKDPAMPLDAVVTEPLLNQSEWIRIAKVRVAEALFLERILQTTRDLLVPTF